MNSITVTLELEFRGALRRVAVCLGPVISLPSRSAPVRSLTMRTESGCESRQVVDAGVPFHVVVAHVQAVLAFELRKEAA